MKILTTITEKGLSGWGWVFRAGSNLLDEGDTPATCDCDDWAAAGFLRGAAVAMEEGFAGCCGKWEWLATTGLVEDGSNSKNLYFK